MKNALLGYSYQQDIALLMLVKMDVEREIDKLTLEADVDHHFDDINLETGSGNYYLQIKDFKNIAVDTLSISGHKILIGGTWHELSPGKNVIFFKEIAYEPNCMLLDFPAFEFSGVFIVSMSREDVAERIEKLYQGDLQRKSIIGQFFSRQMDERTLVFEKVKLPLVSVYHTNLSEPTINISRKILEFDDLLFIEGNPGIGKSHLVGLLESKFQNAVLYRFWVSSQDANVQERLKYRNFLTDLAKKLFNDYRERKPSEIFAALREQQAILIIDGLDHVENYNQEEFDLFIAFIGQVQNYCKTIVLSRPLQFKISWKKQVLANWNEEQTREVLGVLYHIDGYEAGIRIYELTGGYPILVSYVAQQFKIDGKIPAIDRFESINAYYDHLLKDEKGKRALSLFICCRSFLMRSELNLFLDDYALGFVDEFIEERPYLFERRLNRVSLFHDSLNTYLRKTGIVYSSLEERVGEVVYRSLMSGERRFQSRVNSFGLSVEQQKAVVRRYASINTFKTEIDGAIDFEAVREFYMQLRDMLDFLQPGDLDVCQYYDLVLILNLIQRDHVATDRSFQSTYIQTLILNGFTEEDITSKKFFFAMWYYLITKDAVLLFNVFSDQMYDTQDFYADLEDKLEEEADFFALHESAFESGEIRRVLGNADPAYYSENLIHILVNLYLHNAYRETFGGLFLAIKHYMCGEENKAVSLLLRSANTRAFSTHQAPNILEQAKERLLALGIDPDTNAYTTLTLREYIIKRHNANSYDLTNEILNYLRLSLHEQRKIDLKSISIFWTKYYKRGDYTLLALDTALTAFEVAGKVSWESSVRLITAVQKVSEKGYRGLLCEYIMAHDPAFILTILEKFEAKDLRISWLDLAPDYLDALPADLYKSALHELLRYHGHTQEITADEIRNLIGSNKLPLLQRDLKNNYFKVSVQAADEIIPLLDQFKIAYRVQARSDQGRNESPEERYEQGILDDRNAYLIQKLKLTPSQVAATSDGNYTALAVPELFKQFPKAAIQREFAEILFHALTGRSKMSDYHHVTWVMPGTILKIMRDHEIVIPDGLLDSFKSYIDLSLFDFG